MSEDAPPDEAPAAPEAPLPPGFLAALREGVRLTPYLHVATALVAMRSCTGVRVGLSRPISVRVDIDFPDGAAPAGGEPDAMPDTARWRAQCAVRALHRQADLPRVHLGFPMKKTPIKKRELLRRLRKACPTVAWDDCARIRVVCRVGGDLILLEPPAQRHLDHLGGVDTGAFIDNAHLFKSVTWLNVSLSQLMSMAAGEAWPQIRRLKVTCMDGDFASPEFEIVGRVFPKITRLHLAILPSAFVALSGPGFATPADLRISLLQETADRAGRLALESNFFVASHMLSMPFRWRGDLFANVQRLQMSELCERHGGLAMEQMADLLRAMPQLRRLGTLSPSAVALLNLASEDCHLEELVVVMDPDDAPTFFGLFLPLEHRTRLQRLAVYLHAPDGCVRVKEKTENAICGGWHSIATSYLRPSGFVTFSVENSHLLETVSCQLPWAEPRHFCLDRAPYSHGRVPRSTPLEESLPFQASELVDRPAGTLVSGPLRPGAGLSSTLGRTGMSRSHSLHASGRAQSPSFGRASSPSLGRSRHGASLEQQSYPWMGMPLADAIEACKNME